MKAGLRPKTKSRKQRKAERLGLPAQTAQAFLNSGIHTRATVWRWVHYGIYVLAAWVCGLFILFLAGKVFSKLTLRFIERGHLDSSVSDAEAVLRRYYRRLINIAGKIGRASCRERV